MDAKITKSRLGNYLAYDWLKILVCVALVVMCLCIVFTTMRTMPGRQQIYELYAYTNLSTGSGNDFDEAYRQGIFSYEILDTSFETFDATDTYSNTAFMARRAAGQGTALLVCDYDYTVQDEEGNETVRNAYDDFISGLLTDEGQETERMSGFLDLTAYSADCERYLATIFGEAWRTNAEPAEDAVRSAFMARNAKDKRFRGASKREQGIALERERLVKLREDYLCVEELLERGVYSYNTYTSAKGVTYTNGIRIGGLAKLTDFVYYLSEDDEGKPVRRSEGITLLLFENRSDRTDLKFETYSLLRWLAEEYGA